MWGAVHCSQKYTNRSKVLLCLYIIVSVCAPITNPQFVIFEWHLQLLEYTAGEESFFNAFLFVAFKGRRRTLLFVAKAPPYYTGRKEWQYHEKRSASAFTFFFPCPLFSSHETILFYQYLGLSHALVFKIKVKGLCNLPTSAVSNTSLDHSYEW